MFRAGSNCRCTPPHIPRVCCYRAVCAHLRTCPTRARTTRFACGYPISQFAFYIAVRTRLLPVTFTHTTFLDRTRTHCPRAHPHRTTFTRTVCALPRCRARFAYLRLVYYTPFRGCAAVAAVYRIRTPRAAAHAHGCTHTVRRACVTPLPAWFAGYARGYIPYWVARTPLQFCHTTTFCLHARCAHARHLHYTHYRSVPAAHYLCLPFHTTTHSAPRAFCIAGCRYTTRHRARRCCRTTFTRSRVHCARYAHHTRRCLGATLPARLFPGDRVRLLPATVHPSPALLGFCPRCRLDYACWFCPLPVVDGSYRTRSYILPRLLPRAALPRSSPCDCAYLLPFCVGTAYRCAALLPPARTWRHSGGTLPTHTTFATRSLRAFCARRLHPQFCTAPHRCCHARHFALHTFHRTPPRHAHAARTRTRTHLPPRTHYRTCLACARAPACLRAAALHAARTHARCHPAWVQ